MKIEIILEQLMEFDWTSMFYLFPLMSIWVLFAAWFAGYLKSVKNIRTPYTRKIFHVCIFTAAGIFHIFYGLPAVLIFGSIAACAVMWAVFKGDGNPFYEAMARPSDAPRRTLFIIVPLITTALGGVLSNIFFFPFAFIGYLVGGWGDAVGEPVGTKWGKHRYKVPSLAGVPATRSIEGSFAVALVGFLAATGGLLFYDITLDKALYIAAACGITGALVEAISSHGLDNLTIQLAASATAYYLIS